MIECPYMVSLKMSSKLVHVFFISKDMSSIQLKYVPYGCAASKPRSTTEASGGEDEPGRDDDNF
jgi:hypothetical protein